MYPIKLTRWATRRWILVVGCLLIVASIAVIRLSQSMSVTPRLPDIATKYQNARRGVEYVGSQACLDCHAEIGKSYRQHPMGRSISPIAEAPQSLKGQETERTVFHALGYDYSLQRRGTAVHHSESKRAPNGTEVARVDGEVKYVLGSGRHAHAFLIQRNDYLFQSPLTLYTQSERWDLAPGFESRDARFERQITPNCLVCHANQADHVAGTEGRYLPPIFREHSIGCERCHGPGQLHVEQPLADALEPNIVNPRKLEGSLREDVCRQCHLLGATTVERYGRELSDYRPGLPYDEFITVFVKEDQSKVDHPNADHVEQMERSACYRGSAGKLGCISCHNPHELPTREARVGFYKNRCLSCHEQEGCSVPVAQRLKQNKNDSCIDCHMPRSLTSDVPHVTTTLHSIPRLASKGLGDLRDAQVEQPGQEINLIPYRRDSMSPERLKSAERDLGVALRHDRSKAKIALPKLKAALVDHPDDLLAEESLGFVLWALGMDEEALGTFERVLAKEPERVSSLEASALVASKMRRYETSTKLWQRAILADPWRSSFSAELAFDLTRMRSWEEATKAARQSLALNPSNRTAREALILALLRTGDKASAERELQALIEIYPRDRDQVERWYQSLR